MMDQRGDQSGLASLKKATDTLSAADQRAFDVNPDAWAKTPADPLAERADALAALEREVSSQQELQAEYDRLMPAETPAEPAVEVVAAEADVGAEQCANALLAGDNAAECLPEAIERDLVDLIKAHFDMSFDRIRDRYDYWSEAEITHDIYVPAAVADENGRTVKRKVIDVIKTPYSRAISDTVCTYHLAVFGGSPAFRIEPSGPGAKLFGAKIVEQALHHNMRRVGYEARLHQMFQDDNRYGMSPTLVAWGRDGNYLVNLDPWSCFPDPRVTSQNRHEADFFGYRSWASLGALKRRGGFAKLDRLEKSTPKVSWPCNAYLRETIRGQSVDPMTPTRAEDSKIGLSSAHVINTMWIWLDPRQVGIPAPFGLYRVTVADEQHVIKFDTSPYPHGEIPVVMGEGLFDAHKTFGGSVYDLLMPLQRFQDWLLRTRVENVQTIVQNRLIVDPSRINIKDILDPNAARLVRTLPGQDPKAALLPIDVPDATKGYWADLDTAGQLMQRLSAASDTAQGIQADTQRTATEIQRLVSMGQQRLGSQARLKSATSIRPMVAQMIQNLQYFGVDGGVVQLPRQLTQNAEGWYHWTQNEILGPYDYAIVDGTLPTDPRQNTELLLRALQVISETGTGQSWDIDQFVERIIQSLGFYDVDEWRAKGAPAVQAPQNQVVPDEQIAREVEAGNLVSAQDALAIPGTTEQPVV